MLSEKVLQPIWIKKVHVLDRRIWVYYLIINEWASKHLADQIEIEPDERFFKTLGEHVEAYVAGKEPPEAIAGAVMNVADDYMAGREVVLRAGDYIALQNFMRQQAAY